MKTHSCTQESEFFFQIQLAYLFTWQMKLCARVDSFFFMFWSRRQENVFGRIDFMGFGEFESADLCINTG